MVKSRFSRVVGPSIHSPYFRWHSAENNISRWTHSHLLSWKTRLLTAFHLVTICITIAEKANLASPCHAAWVKTKWCHCSQQVDQNFKTFETYQPPRSHYQNRSRPALCIWIWVQLSLRYQVMYERRWVELVWHWRGAISIFNTWSTKSGLMVLFLHSSSSLSFPTPSPNTFLDIDGSSRNCWISQASDEEVACLLSP